MISLADCKKVITKDGRKISDVELEKMRAFLYLIAELDYQNCKIQIDERKSNTIYTGINR